MRLYNQHTRQIFETASDDELHVQVYLDVGFLPATEPEVVPGLVAEPVTHEPVAAKRRRGKTEPAEGKDTD